MTPDKVSAVIVTRGDVDLAPIVATLPYSEVVIWAGSSASCYGRYMAAATCTHDTIYYQDDDLIFTAHDQLLAAYQPHRIVANMPSPWYEQAGYDKLDCCLVGAGSLVPRGLPEQAFQRYLEHWPLDDLFLTYCDQISGIINPTARFDFGYDILPYASGPDRIYTQPGADDRKRLVQQRAVALR